ncbi:MAG TPA: amidohydrolase [Candidatus Companilactobacillus pullicola]|uniref:Amidohydrolase n=1 Tax=Candidatus Companilactobacillus pullicola TaxID=2838523 RepID=A0A9D1ZK50_9LACO|nr:amidohydrolase [Candidatus Companilactobacillus pullicola]
MNQKLDVFAHVLPINLLKNIKQDVPSIIEDNLFLQIPSLTDLELRHQNFPQDVKQIISNVNLNPEDYFDAEKSAQMCWDANEEMLQLQKDNADIFESVVAMIPMNNLDESIKIIREVSQNPSLIGIQVFTRALGKSIADPEFEEVFKTAAESKVPIWLHPVFDERKPDNNLTFSWEYELTQVMYQIVTADYFEKYPDLKIIVHHAGAMVPFFAGRIKYTLPKYYEDFKKFYVDTAILGNPKALELTMDFYGTDHLVFGTDAPFAVMPNGATKEITQAIDEMDISDTQRNAIYHNNFINLLKEK